MRKDVKRSLILWPAAAAVVVACLSSYSIMQDVSQRIGPDTESLAVATQPSFHFSSTKLELPARRDQGSRGLALPERVAEVWSIKVVNSAAVGFQSLPMTESVPATTRALPKPTLHRSPSVLENSMRFDGIVQLNPPAALLPESMLPQSNRALAKPEFQRRTATAPVSPAIAAPVAADEAADKLASALRQAANQPAAAVDRRVTDARKPAIMPSWPPTVALDTQLRDLAALADGRTAVRRDQFVSAAHNDEDVSAAQAQIESWTNEVARTLHQLQDLPRLGDDQAIGLIERLEDLANRGIASAETVSDRAIQVRWLQASWGLSRRVAIWKPVARTSGAQDQSEPRTKFAIAMKPAEFVAVDEAIADVRRILPESGDPTGWERFLLLDQITTAANDESQPQRFAVAHRFCSRVDRSGLHPAHRQWLQRDEIRTLQRAIEPWARGVVDYADLLSQIEMQESVTNEDVESDIARAMQTLRFAAHPDAAAVAESIDTYYRNANIRIAVSDQMISRMIPQLPSQSVPVRTEMMGSQIRGTSDIQSDLKVSLLPDSSRWSIQVQTIGKVHTNATGFNGPVAVRTVGDATFTATTPILISPAGVTIGESVASADGHTQLRSINTSYDGWPIVGSLVRSAAARRFDQMSSLSSQISNRKIATEIETNVDREFHQRLGEATARLSNSILGPLSQLQLDPTVTDMQTSEQRLVARYRLAGNHQLAAYTPRPRAMSDSLLSVQVHQSAINNTLEQLVPTTDTIPLREAIGEAISLFGQSDLQIPDDIPSDVAIQFSSIRPIVAEFKDDRVWLTMRIVRLQNGERLNLTKFIVQAVYRPEIDGLQAKLVRDGHLRISGPGMSMRERLPIRAIFNKVLSTSRSLPLTIDALSENPALEGLAINQLELRDGWIAMAIRPVSADRIATSPAAQ
jgi:hypothetical protein